MPEYINISPGPLTAFQLDLDPNIRLTHQHISELAGNPSVDFDFSDSPENLASDHQSEMTAVDASDPDAEQWSQRLLNCVAAQYGLPIVAGAVGAAGAYAGSTIPKAGNTRLSGALGSSDRMTRLSFYTHRIERSVPLEDRTIHQRILTRRVTGVSGQTMRAISGTRVVGRFIGRFCGPIGWVMLAADAAMIAACVSNADNWLRERWQNAVDEMIQNQDPVEQMILRGIATGRWIM